MIKKGIVVEAEVSKEKAIVKYIPVKNLVYYIDVWDCTPRFAKRIHTGQGQMKTEIISLKNKKAQKLFDKLVMLRDVIINMSGHYYIETIEQKRILDEIVINEGLFCCEGYESCDEFIERNCPLSERCSEWKKVSK
ncbi:MAG: hypothetical protein ACFFDN_29160 [Candidatus Hodarchaeota archaeon]